MAQWRACWSPSPGRERYVAGHKVSLINPTRNINGYRGKLSEKPDECYAVNCD